MRSIKGDVRTLVDEDFLNSSLFDVILPAVCGNGEAPITPVAAHAPRAIIDVNFLPSRQQECWNPPERRSVVIDLLSRCLTTSEFRVDLEFKRHIDTAS